ncbi:hypothetical protein CXB51_025558 [Gossypium anomalum]|uniref:Piwi domain-containing protein n=1 Tax=Gossypium anomalum TaxID=47600 RepID=A0A8J6CRM7_9ROSI|nr:hypothetical protein CXB51_025558 [Gossypium anomalum]
MCQRSDYIRIRVTQDNQHELKEIWDQWGIKAKNLFYNNHGDSQYLLDLGIDENLFRAITQYWNLVYSCFTFGKADMVSVVEEYLVCGRCPMIQVYSKADRIPTFMRKMMNVMGIGSELNGKSRKENGQSWNSCLFRHWCILMLFPIKAELDTKKIVRHSMARRAAGQKMVDGKSVGRKVIGECMDLQRNLKVLKKHRCWLDIILGSMLSRNLLVCHLSFKIIRTTSQTLEGVHRCRDYLVDKAIRDGSRSFTDHEGGIAYPKKGVFGNENHPINVIYEEGTEQRNLKGILPYELGSSLNNWTAEELPRKIRVRESVTREEGISTLATPKIAEERREKKKGGREEKGGKRGSSGGTPAKGVRSSAGHRHRRTRWPEKMQVADRQWRWWQKVGAALKLPPTLYAYAGANTFNSSCFKVPTIILGMGALFGFPEQSDVPSIAAMILSSKPVSDKVDDGIMKEALLDFYTSLGKRKPDQIIIFRDGVSEYQFNQVLIKLLKLASSLTRSGTLKIVVIVVRKNHHTKFFQQGSSDNMLHGTIIDNKVCHPKNNDFYLGTHAGMIGITRQTHYHVLLDQAGFSADDLQKFVHSLSYISQRKHTTAIFVVAPICYAYLVASQLGAIYED